MFIVFLGSIKQEEQMKKIAEEIKKHFFGFIDCSFNYNHPIEIYVPSSEEDGTARFSLAERFFYLMDTADLIVVVPKPDGTYGEGVSYELAYAKKNFPSKIIVYHD